MGWIATWVDLSAQDQVHVSRIDQGEIQVDIGQIGRRLQLSARGGGIEALRTLHAEVGKALAEHDLQQELPEVRHAG